VFIIKNIYFRQRNCAQELQSRIDNQETQTTLDTRHRTKTHKTNNTIQKTK